MRLNTLLKSGLPFICLYLSLGCKPPERYVWGNYEPSLYKLAKDPSSFEKYGTALLSQIQEGESSRRVPPGVYAEYGYFLLVSKNSLEASTYFKKEKERWPESGLLMDRMIKLASPPTPEAQKAR